MTTLGNRVANASSLPPIPRNLFLPISGPSRAGILAFIAAFAILVGVENIVSGQGNLLVLSLLLVYLFLLSLPIAFIRDGGGWLHPLVVTTMLWGLGRDAIPKAGVYAYGLQGHLALPGYSQADLDAVVAFALGLEIIGLMAVFAGFAATPMLRIMARRHRVPLLAGGVQLKMLCIALIALIAFYILVRAAGSWQGVLLQRGMRADQRIYADVGKHWNTFIGSLRIACVVWFALDSRAVRSALFWGLFALSLGIYFAVTGSRGGVIIPIFALVALYAVRRRRMPLARGLAVVLLAVAALGVLGDFRAATRDAASLSDVVVETRISAALINGIGTLTHYGGEKSGIYGIVGRVPHQVDHLWGESYGAILGAVIPRVLWPQKPKAGGRLNAERIFDRPFDGIPPGNVGEAFWNFGVPGVILIMFLWGAALRLMAVQVRSNPANPSMWLLYILTIVVLQPNSVTFFNWLHIIVAAVGALWWFTRPHHAPWNSATGTTVAPGRLLVQRQ
jgi:oligosaccharide repeat unit polymerase